MSIQNPKQISDVKVMLKTGQNGVGIRSIALTDTTGLVDTYTITFDDNRVTTFTVTNGSSIQSIEKTGTSGNIDTYTITQTNGNTTTFNVTNGFPSTYDSANVTFNNTGTNISANRVQGAIVELDSEKYPKTGGTISGNVNLEGNGGATLNVGTNGVGIINIGGGNTFKGSISTGQDEFTELTANRTYTLPNKSGTLALQEDAIVRGATTLELTYNSTTQGLKGTTSFGSMNPFPDGMQAIATVTGTTGTMIPFYLKTNTVVSSSPLGEFANVTVEAIPFSSGFMSNATITVRVILV
jgi:hypothetical protein